MGVDWGATGEEGEAGGATPTPAPPTQSDTHSLQGDAVSNETDHQSLHHPHQAGPSAAGGGPAEGGVGPTHFSEALSAPSSDATLLSAATATAALPSALRPHGSTTPAPHNPYGSPCTPDAPIGQPGTHTTTTTTPGRKRVTIQEYQSPVASPEVGPVGSPCCSPQSPSLLSPGGGGGGDDFAQILGELQCPICLDVYSDPVTLACGHTLCKEHVAELVAMGPGGGGGGFDCPKCRVRCGFPGEGDVRVNLEMKNMILMVQRAARKSREERRGERERALAAQIRKSEKIEQDLRQREHRLLHDRQQWADEKARLESAAAAAAAPRGGVAGVEAQPAAVEHHPPAPPAAAPQQPAHLEQERQRLEREKLLLQQQRDEMNAHSKHLILQQQQLRKLQAERGGGGGGGGGGGAPQWDTLSASEKRAELQRLREEAERQKREEREERDARIEREMSEWMRQTDRINARAIEARSAGFPERGGGGPSRGTPPVEEAGGEAMPQQRQPGQGEFRHDVMAPQLATTRFAEIRQLPVRSEGCEQQQHYHHHHHQQQQQEAPDPTALYSSGGGGIPLQVDGREGEAPPQAYLTEVPHPGGGDVQPQQHHQRPRIAEPAEAPAPLAPHVGGGGGRINPITGFPEPERLEEVEGDGRFGKYFEDQWRQQAYAMNPPRRVPEDYPNYHYSLTDGVDHELEEVMEGADDMHRESIVAAHKKRIVAEKARIAEQRALAMVAQYKAEHRAKRLVSTGGWDTSTAATPAPATRRPGSAGSSGSRGGGGGVGSAARRPKPLFQPKIGRPRHPVIAPAVAARQTHNPVAVVRRAQGGGGGGLR